MTRETSERCLAPALYRLYAGGVKAPTRYRTDAGWFCCTRTDGRARRLPRAQRLTGIWCAGGVVVLRGPASKGSPTSIERACRRQKPVRIPRIFQSALLMCGAAGPHQVVLVCPLPLFACQYPSAQARRENYPHQKSRAISSNQASVSAFQDRSP